MLQIVRKKLTPDEISPPNLRYNGDCDCVEQTPDGGTTWVPVPSADPRTADGFRRPPLETADPRCDAAAGMTAFFRTSLSDLLINLSAGANAWSGASFLLFALGFLTGIGVLIALLLDFCTIVLSIGVVGVEAAFTDEVYDALQCLFYCNIGDDGQVSADQFAALQDGITEQFGALSDVNVVTQGWLANLGPVGLSNIGVVKAITGDCGDCECTDCYYLDFRETDGTSVGWLTQAGTWTPGTGIVGAYQDPSANSDAYGYWTFPDPDLHIGKIEVYYTKTASAGANGVNNKFMLLPVTGYSTVAVATNAEDTTGTAQVILWPCNVDAQGFGWDLNSGTAPVDAILEGIKIFYSGGTGLMPEPNC